MLCFVDRIKIGRFAAQAASGTVNVNKLLICDNVQPHPVTYMDPACNWDGPLLEVLCHLCLFITSLHLLNYFTNLLSVIWIMSIIMQLTSPPVTMFTIG